MALGPVGTGVGISPRKGIRSAENPFIGEPLYQLGYPGPQPSFIVEIENTRSVSCHPAKFLRNVAALNTAEEH
jgi:hypothetical protein